MRNPNELNRKRNDLGMPPIEDQTNPIKRIKSNIDEIILTKNQLLRLCNDCLKEKCKETNYISTLWIEKWLEDNDIL
jgi:hypothetical protein